MKKRILTFVCIAAIAFPAIAASPEEVKREPPEYDKAENVVDAIVALHPCKTVFVDFWATWCGPCKFAFRQIEPLKPWMEENGIVKVYLAAHHSDPTEWESMIGDIGGEHYRLKEEEWKAVLAKYGIEGIPTYQIYNKKGEKTYQQTGFPGIKRLQAEFEKAL